MLFGYGQFGYLYWLYFSSVTPC